MGSSSVGMLSICLVSFLRHSDKFWSVTSLTRPGWDQTQVSAALALMPWWLLLVMVVGDVTVTVVKDATGALIQD